MPRTYYYECKKCNVCGVFVGEVGIAPTVKCQKCGSDAVAIQAYRDEAESRHLYYLYLPESKSNWLAYTEYLTMPVDISANAKKTLLCSQVAYDEPVTVDNAHPGVISIVSALTKYAETHIKRSRQSDNPQIKIGPGSSYDNILKRAVNNIFDKYGDVIKCAAVTKQDGCLALNNLKNVSIQHSTEKWIANKDGNLVEVAKLAVAWAMSSDPSVNSAVVAACKKHHKNSSLSTVIGAYAAAICLSANNRDLLNLLAEIRLRWGPITYGPIIYLEISKSDLELKEEWEEYNMLIHEALHSVEHPNFCRFLSAHIPAGLQSDVREGITEYLAQQIWIDVLKGVETPRNGEWSKPSANPDKPMSIISLTLKEALFKVGDYAIQKQTIEELVNLWKDGTGKDRLIAAYFAGNVEAFLPKF